jgi:hypothetical protein
VFKLDPQRRRGHALQRRPEMVERRMFVTRSVSALRGTEQPLRGTEQPLRAPVGIGGHARGVLESTSRGREGALGVGARGHAVKSLGDRVVRAGSGVGLMPEALVAV